ncbi:unnamed protein product [Lota lota]
MPVPCPAAARLWSCSSREKAELPRRGVGWVFGAILNLLGTGAPASPQGPLPHHRSPCLTTGARAWHASRRIAQRLLARVSQRAVAFIAIFTAGDQAPRDMHSRGDRMKQSYCRVRRGDRDM